MSRKLLLALVLVLTVGLPLGGNVQASPATFTVNSTGDAPDSDTSDGICDDGTGNCTLRAAIEQANATLGMDTIAFNIPGVGPHTIQPASALPTVTDPVVIDGYTQPGASPNTNPPELGSNAVLRIELDGSNAGADANGLHITSGNSTVRGLVINRFGRDGIMLQTNGGNAIEGNFIGTDVTGTVPLGNGAAATSITAGVRIVDAPGNTVGGTAAGARNVISGNAWHGVEIGGAIATGNVVQGNFIGTDASGTADLGNGLPTYAAAGVRIDDAPGNTVGGTAAGAGNVISGNDNVGIELWSSGNQVRGNLIGTNATGTAALGNGAGVFVPGGAGNVIGGTTAAARNVISGNDRDGVALANSAPTGTEVLGNFIGVDITGTVGLGNGMDGVWIEDSSNNTIGGTAAGAGNVISGNGVAYGGAGVAILAEFGGAATGNVVQGNLIGTDANGTAALGNLGSGVSFFLASGNVVGGTAIGAPNVIAYNSSAGVAGSSNTVRGNSIHSNGGKGIVSGGAPPVIDSVGSASGHTDPKCYPCTVDVFSDSEDEGRIYHGSGTTNDDATGTWTYTGAVTGPNITATITDASGNTSEFSVPVAYSPPVGGVAELPDFAGTTAGEASAPSGGSGWSADGYAVLAGGLAAAVLAVTASAWYAKRRWLR